MPKKKTTVAEDVQTMLLKLSVLLIILAGIATYLATQSKILAGVVVGVLLGSIFMIALFVQVKKEQQLRRSGIHEIDQMSGTKFEQYLQQLLQTQGYDVKLTPETGDYGADLVLSKQPLKIVVQAKRWNGNVGIAAVQQVIGAKAHYQANEAWVITNSYFTEAAVKLAKSNAVKLIDRQMLISMLLSHSDSQ